MKKFKRSFALLCSILLIFTLVEPLTMMASASSAPSITYWAHVQNHGWMSPKNHGTQVPSEDDYAGTTGQSLQLECLQIQLDSTISGAVYVQSYIQNIGWTSATGSGCGQAQRTGTEGQGLRMEAIRIWLYGDITNCYSVKYRVYVQNYGWMNWVSDTEIAGTTGQSLRIEAIQIYLVEKPPSITYWAHVQNYGWMAPKNHGTQVPGNDDYAGTTGQSLQLECLQIQLNSTISGAVYVQSYIQNIGWTGATGSGCGQAQRTGTEGQGLRMEAIRIWLYGDITNCYSVKYRVYVQNYGWMNWVSDTEIAGTTGQSLRIEAIQICLVEKPPSITYWAHVQNYGWMAPKNHGMQVPGDDDYAGTTNQGLQLECLQIQLNSTISGAVYAQSHIQDIGWTGATGSGCGQAQRTGTEGQGRRMEAIRLWLQGEIANRYSIEYRTHVQNIGWQNWVRDGATAGTEGQSLRIEAIQIRLVEKSSGVSNNTGSTSNNTGSTSNRKPEKVFNQNNYGQYNYGYASDDDERKGNHATIASGGCGLVSITNAAYYLNGVTIPPDVLAEFSINNKYRPNGTTKEGLVRAFCDSKGQKYGIKWITDIQYDSSSANTVTKAKSYLQNGNVAVVHVKEHFIALVDYDAKTDKYLILDSAPSGNRGTSTGYRWLKAADFTGYLAVRSGYQNKNIQIFGQR